MTIPTNKCTKWGYRDGVKVKETRSGWIYTWCSRMSDRITSQARESTKQGRTEQHCIVRERK